MAIRMKLSKLTMGTVSVTGISTDGTMAANSDALLPTQQAVKEYVASAITGDFSASYISVVATPTAGNFPQLSAEGELVNSEYDETSFAAADHDHDDEYIAVIAGAATGDMMYYDGAAWVAVTGGASGDVLTLVGTTPTWVTP